MEAIQRIRGQIKLLTQLVHHGDEKTGSTPILRTMTIWSEALQKHVRVPFVSGNAIRGMLRRLIMRDLLELVDFHAEMVSILTRPEGRVQRG